ncbi:amidohydrolase [Propionibacteriaceae bacterium G57]|uniref:amidohydrolase n=1 Tax=Aestuariimicrobium sp. G57 TaxID=3418485 RepID=UPI003DA6FD49
MTTAIINAHVVPVQGDPFDGTVLFTDGRITAFGPDVAIPDDAELVDARGGWVTPGLVEAHGHVGISEESHGWAGEDSNEGTQVNGARFRALDAIHPTDESFRDALAGGVTTVVVKPGSGNPIGGQTVAVKTWGRIVDEMVIKQPASMKSALGENPKRFYGQDQKIFPKTRQGVAAALRDAFTAARNYGAHRAEAVREGKAFDIDLTNEALLQVLDGELPWCQHCHRVDDIATAMRLADEFGYRLIINHGTEAHLIADVIAERNLPVVIGPLLTARTKQELQHRSIANPGRLVRAGVKIAITTDAPVVPINLLNVQASIAVNEGLDPDAALRSITQWPAEIMGLDERVGVIAEGKDADLVLWTVNPLDATSRAMKVWIEGREVYHYDESTSEGITLDPYSTLGSTVAEPGRERR